LSYREDFRGNHSLDDYITEGNIESVTVKKYQPIITFGKPDIGSIVSNNKLMFNDKGDITEISIFSSYSKDLFAKTNISYNKSGDLISALSYDANSLIWKVTYQRDGSNLIETNYNGNGQEDIKREYILDSDNCVIEYKSVNNKGNITESYLQKCSEGKIVERQSRLSTDKVIFEYDEKKRMIGSNASYGVRRINRYLFEDDHGNWTRKEEVMGDKVDKIIIRSFVYHEK
jgi:hypothetical protein